MLNETAALTDEELVALSLEYRQSFVELIERYERKMIQYILRISNVSYQDAEDIAQEVFIKVYTNLHDFDPHLKFSSWIYRIAHNEMISHYRKRQARPQHESTDIDDEAVERIVADWNVAKIVDTKLLSEQVQQALGKLDVKYREILVLRYIEDKSYEEISDILRKPPGTVATLLHRAKQQCQQAFQRIKDHYE